MISIIIFFSSLLVPASLVQSSSVLSNKKLQRDFLSTSDAGKSLLLSARQLDGDDDGAGGVDFSFVSGYAIKFQGCHHISQWNDNYDDDYNDVRILTKRLIRFRLCPIGSCSEVKSAGCTSKYGDYVVDMNTFVYYYLQALKDEEDYQCTAIYNSCSNSCYNDDDCMLNCYANAGLASCLNNDDDAGNGGFDAINYAKCAAFSESDDDYSQNYYIGPYCSDQGGEVHLGLFTDDSCTVMTSNTKGTFYSLTGYELPYTSSSVIPSSCMSCLEPNDNAYNDYQEDDTVKDICSSIYSKSGKCESKMAVDYPNESACTYIEGIKIIRDDGVIRTSTKRKSKAAAVAIGIFTTIAVLLGGYVYYLRTKLGRAKINLSPPGATLT